MDDFYHRRTPNKLPSSRTLAKHYDQGRLCDYPAEDVMSAVNQYADIYDYDPVTVPLQLGFKQFLYQNFDVLTFLANNRSPETIAQFANNPKAFMDDHGFMLYGDFDKFSPHLMVLWSSELFFSVIRFDEFYYKNSSQITAAIRQDVEKMNYPKNYFSYYIIKGVRGCERTTDFNELPFAKAHQINLDFNIFLLMGYYDKLTSVDTDIPKP